MVILKVLAYAVAIMVVLGASAFATGTMLPKAHTAVVRVHIGKAPQAVYDAITDVAQAPAWRSGLKKVEVLSQPNEPLQWRETAGYGTMIYAMDLASPPSRVATRIVDTEQGFAGGWTFEITPEGNGSSLLITENGEVHNPMFRFMSKFVFGQYRALETYAQDLGRHFNESVHPQRVQR